MFSNCYLGAPCGLQSLRGQNEALSAKVLEQVADNQELLTLNKFEHQSSEYQLRHCLQERISDLESWRWVLQDLANRLADLIEALRYEHKALRVVVERVKKEIDLQTDSRPGALTPHTDPVEEAIKEEHKFLREQKKKFEKLIEDIEEQIPAIEKVKMRLEVAALNKEQAIHVEEKLSDIDVEASNLSRIGRKKKKLSPLTRWERRCYALKRKGLCALSHALSIRQQVRGCRSLLSVVAQTYATRVDSLLKRRLYLNTRKLEDLQWQKGEVQQDYKFLADELTSTEQNVLDTMSKIKLMEARLADRRLRPPQELTKDPVDRKLKDELNRLKQFLKSLRNNIERITTLQGDLTASIAQMNCVVEDLTQVIQLDKDRIRSRTYEDSAPAATGASTGTSAGANTGTSAGATDTAVDNREPTHTRAGVVQLSTIREEDENLEEEDEEDDYPFDF